MWSSLSKDDEEAEDDPYGEMKAAYPELEFVDYNDPSYQIDIGMDTSSALSAGVETDEAVEELREERRRKNDEYQFETYFQNVLKSGDDYYGEWTVYRAVYDKDKDEGGPGLQQMNRVLKVRSSGHKVVVDPAAKWRVDGEYVAHTEELVAESNEDQDHDDVMVKELLDTSYWPEQLTSGDFRGPAGIMVVGNAYTVCATVPSDNNDGPFTKINTELGLQSADLRFRVKLDYRATTASPTTTTATATASPPPLSLHTLTVCRERLARWPRDPERRVSSDLTLFGPPGAQNGLFDPPPVAEGTEHRYTTVDLEGGATLLFPYRLEQHGNNSWVTSLDWAPGDIRYQVDRKVDGTVKGLRTLEVCEVETEDADKYRPTDGGANMRQ